MAEFKQIDDTTFSVDEKTRSTVVGDKNKTTFEPSVEIRPWEDEEDCFKVSKSVSRRSVVLTDIHDRSDLIWDDGTEHWQIQPFGQYIPSGIKSGYHKWNGAQFIIKLAKRPVINRDGYARFPFAISGHENMELLHQPGVGHPDWQDEWKQGTPDWAEWSIAVYHKNKRWSSKGHNYKTGKVCHIFRPWCIDNLGNFTWGRWEIDLPRNRIIKLIPKSAFSKGSSWLIDATFGNTAQGASKANAIDNAIYSTAEGEGPPAASGTVDNLHGYLFASSVTARDMQMALYNSADQAFIANSASDSVSSGTDVDGDVSFPYGGTPPAVDSAITYDISAWGNPAAGDVFVYDDFVSSAGYQDTDLNQFTWPDPLLTTAANRRISLYVEYTASGAAIPVMMQHYREMRK